jgi:hypothetical protein
MKKQELHDFLKGLANAGMESMIASGGSYPQRAIVFDTTGNLHVIVVPGEPLHGLAMATALAQFADMVGGADVIAVQSHARLNMTTLDEWKKRPVGYSIARDEANPEVLITAGRSREHTAVIINPYTRKPGRRGKDIITFEKSDPQVEQGLDLKLIPNIWERVN